MHILSHNVRIKDDQDTRWGCRFLAKDLDEFALSFVGGFFVGVVVDYFGDATG